MVLIADKLIGIIPGVANVHGAEVFKVVEAFLGGDGKSIMVAVVVGGDQEEEGIAAGVRGTISGAVVLDEGNVGLVATVIGTVGSGAHGSTLDEGPLDGAGFTDFIEVMEIIFDLVGHVIFIAVVVMGLDDVPVLLAFGRGAVALAAARLEDHEGLNHGGGVGTVHGKAHLFGHAGTLFGCAVSMTVVVIVPIGSFLGDGFNIDARRICNDVKKGMRMRNIGFVIEWLDAKMIRKS